MTWIDQLHVHILLGDALRPLRIFKMLYKGLSQMTQPKNGCGSRMKSSGNQAEL